MSTTARCELEYSCGGGGDSTVMKSLNEVNNDRTKKMESLFSRECTFSVSVCLFVFALFKEKRKRQYFREKGGTEALLITLPPPPALYFLHWSSCQWSHPPILANVLSSEQSLSFSFLLAYSLFCNHTHTKVHMTVSRSSGSSSKRCCCCSTFPLYVS